MRRATWLGVVGVCAGVAAWGWAERAHACGGCIAPASSVTVVTAHRMVVAISSERTTLWDQIVYSGAPDEFVWVLPVDATMTDVEVADARFFVELDGATAPVVIGPARWASTDEGCGCGGDDDGAAAPTASGTPAVTVYDREVVGPYETVTIGSESPTALVDWLQSNGFAVQDATTPIIGHYVERGMAFVVVRLVPGRGVQEMQPLRVSYPGASPMLPLRMVAAGASDDVSLLLWVFGEGRYEAGNYANGVISSDDLVAPSAPGGTSNYETVFDAALATLDGPGWITESAVGASSAGTVGIQDYSSFFFLAPTGRTSPQWAIAMEGLDGSAILTRLRTKLPPSMLTEDLMLAPSTGPETVSRLYRASRTSSRASFPAAPVLALLVIAAVYVSERWRRKRRSAP